MHKVEGSSPFSRFLKARFCGPFVFLEQMLQFNLRVIGTIVGAAVAPQAD